MSEPRALVGRQIDRFEVLQHIGQGGMANVYLAYDVALARKVVLKTLLPELARDQNLMARFQREAQATAQLSHPNIVQIYTTGVTPANEPYIALQYVEGGSLHDHLQRLKQRNQAVATQYALALVRQMADALDAAHQAGIIHRDIKPGNILLRTDGTPVLSDLGIAAIRLEATRLTRTGGILGTPHYMSPEQARGRPVDGRSDIYSLGVILYEMLSGRLPFRGDSPLAIMHQHLYEQPFPLEETREGLATQTCYVVRTCLQKDPAARYQTASQLVTALDQAIAAEGGMNSFIPDPAIPSSVIIPRPADFPQWLYALIPLVLLVVGAGFYRFFATTPLLETSVTASAPTKSLAQITPSATSTLLIAEAIIRPETTFQPLPTSTPIITPSPTPTPSPTLVPTETATSTPTSTAAPILVQAPLPAAVAVPPTGRVVFTCYIDNVDDICLINADGTGEKRLTAVALTDFYASFAPDGAQILFSSRRDGGFLMYSMNPDGSNVQRLGPAHIGGIYAPAISPDGQRVAFTAAQSGSQQIWVMDRDGSQLQQLTDSVGNNVDPVWSPDSRYIGFASDRDGEMAHFIMDADGTNLRKLVTGVADIGGRSDWSPDGRWLAFYAGPRDDRDIYLAAIDGSVVYQLTDGGSNLAPSFSSDGNWIAFTSYRDGDAELFVMRVNGSDARQLTFNERADWQPRWGP